MQEMRAQYYAPETEGDKNLSEALEQIKEEMEIGCPYCEFMTYWTDLPDDWVIKIETLDKLKEQGFRVVKRYCDKGTLSESFWFIVAWDEFESWPDDEEY